MSHALIYIILGIFDAAAMMLLILKLFMLPVFDYRYKIVAFSTFIALFSYVTRVVLEVPALDLPLQYIFFIVFLRIGLKIKIHLASFISGSGICAYAALQMCLYYLLEWIDLVHVGILKENVGLLLFFFQITSILVAYLIAFLLFRCSLGFSFIIKPPHDFFSREDYFSKRNIVLLIANIISIITILVTTIFLYSGKPLGLLIVAAVSFIVSIYFSGWSDKDDIRKAIEAYRNKNQTG